MKFIFTILFCLILPLPVLAYNEVNCNIPQGDCTTTAGCGWDTDGFCYKCAINEYSTSAMSTCDLCTNYYYDTDSHKTYDPNSPDNHQGQSSCPWICNSGYYQGGVNNDECIQCPTHSTGCTTSGLTYQDVQCDTNYRRVLDHNAHTVECSSCADNATLVGNNCKCKINYYGDGNTKCDKCPAGTTTTDVGAESESDCHMSSNTQFTDKDGNSFYFLSNATGIN